MRGVERLVAFALLVSLAPLLLIVSILIKLTSKGPVIFKQERVGRKKKPFVMWKFRTMVATADEGVHRDHVVSHIRDGDVLQKLDACDSRITLIGRLLRSTYIDELPQLVNVLRGEMSLVGPRPCMDYEAELYPEWAILRYDVKPGMTGLWQVSGKNQCTLLEQLALDVQYVERRSFWLDVKIVAWTIPAVLKSKLAPEAKEKAHEETDTTCVLTS
jgi:lipopolysaccharide/colanic/teichoic acid biosynthesis glycosyltransferase